MQVCSIQGIRGQGEGRGAAEKCLLIISAYRVVKWQHSFIFYLNSYTCITAIATVNKSVFMIPDGVLSIIYREKVRKF